MEKHVPSQITKQLRLWWIWFIFWIALHWVLSLVAVLFGALAAAFTQHAPTYGAIAATASALIGTSNSYRRATGFERAHRRLNNARISFETLDSFTIEALVTANDKAGAILEDSEK